MDLLKIIGRLLNSFSIVLLLFGICLLFLKKKKIEWAQYYLISSLLLECMVMYIGVYLEQNMLILFTISFFIHFIFLTYFYNKKIFKIKSTTQNLLVGFGALPLLLYCTTDSSIIWLQDYARIPYSLIISLYSLGYFYALMMGKLSSEYFVNILNGNILLFFTVDAFLGTGTVYLIKEQHLQLVAWFWFFRAVFLQLFYAALIYYGWQMNKKI